MKKIIVFAFVLAAFACSPDHDLPRPTNSVALRCGIVTHKFTLQNFVGDTLHYMIQFVPDTVPPPSNPNQFWWFDIEIPKSQWLPLMPVGVSFSPFCYQP